MQRIRCPHCYRLIEGAAETFIKSALESGKGAQCPYCNLVFYNNKPLSECEMRRFEETRDKED